MFQNNKGVVLDTGKKTRGSQTLKKGVIGAFCRTYDIHLCIEKYLSDVYEKCAVGDRYTYKDGSSSSGLVVYENGKFAYSNHATDPASGKLCNSFDLVRIHKFGDTTRRKDVIPDETAVIFGNVQAYRR